MSGLLNGKVAFVTGASRGIGAAAARLFSREGATVVLCARSEHALKEQAEQIVATGAMASYVVADLGEAAEIERAIGTVVDRYGRLDVAFNNAGVLSAPAFLADTPEAEFDLLTQVDYKAVYFATAAEVRAMRETAGGGAVVNNSSVSSLAGYADMPAYAAAKRAVNALSASAAIAYGPIRNPDQCHRLGSDSDRDGERLGGRGPGSGRSDLGRNTVAPCRAA
ncbi:SDR family NAD(P)-dependent oxidoreductase [Pseudonocardia sp. MH-G8]|uniref:SDR family NAD(P)-dependent oxidoreductase n=1 Tax=Pseudonocardia sp. MH-G8 TaxID=1854588 RepID=UPI00350E8E23